VKAGSWDDVKIPISAVAEKAGIIRLFLPSDINEIDWMELTSAGKVRRWEF
jgi:hypothetical protein